MDLAANNINLSSYTKLLTFLQTCDINIALICKGFCFQIVDVQQIQCPLWIWRACSASFIVVAAIISSVTILNMTIVIVLCVYRKQIYGLFKKKWHTFNEIKTEICEHYDKNSHIKPIDKSAVSIYYDEGNVAMLVKFDSRDTQFIDEQLMPGLMKYGKSQIGFPRPKSMITVPTKREKLLKWLRDCFCPPSYIAIIVFSPNYLMSQYSHVDIKKIQSKMSRQVDSVFVFVDIGPENSVYAFLKDQRDTRNSVVWKESNFWEKISEITDVEKIALLHERSEDVLRVERDGLFEISSNSYIDADGRRSFHNLSLLQKKVISTVAYKV